MNKTIILKIIAALTLIAVAFFISAIDTNAAPKRIPSAKLDALMQQAIDKGALQHQEEITTARKTPDNLDIVCIRWPDRLTLSNTLIEL